MKISTLLAREITLNASKQTFFIIKILVDKGLKDDCYRAYAYFRWVDDMVDEVHQKKSEKIEFINRQVHLAELLFNGDRQVILSDEEEMLADLIFDDQCPQGLLKSYIYNFLSIIKFDADRHGERISNDAS